MLENHTEYHGTLRIRNPKTLHRWIRSGRYQQMIDNGWIFNVGCGRFTKKKYECNKCRKSTNSPLQEIILNKTSL